jgi:putative NIF3 family GTP cyclohydrolase 1 type 2
LIFPEENKMPDKDLTLTSLKRVVDALDQEFDALSGREDLVQWAVTEENCRWINPKFLKQKTGLMMVGQEKIHAVYTTVFVTDRVVDKLSNEPPSLLVTHHHFNYFEDERGLQPISEDEIRKLERQGHSVYISHAPLDTHPIYGTSVTLSEVVGVRPTDRFYDYFGVPTAVAGEVEEQDFQDFAEHVRKRLLRPKVDVVQHTPRVRKVAVVAGGGDLPDVLREVHDLGADTMLLGTLENRWGVRGVQEAHKEFLRLNEKFKINLIGGSHYNTERLAMVKVLGFLEQLGVPCHFCEDEGLLNAP